MDQRMPPPLYRPLECGSGTHSKPSPLFPPPQYSDLALLIIWINVCFLCLGLTKDTSLHHLSLHLDAQIGLTTLVAKLGQLNWTV